MSTKSRPCEICMKPIEIPRLEATPETRLCKAHAEQIEKYGGEFTRSVSQERTSKAGSLKVNYGGINTSTKRNQAAIERLKDDFEAEKWNKQN